MTIDDEDEGDAEEEYCEGARRILRVIASVSRVSHGNRITKLDIFVTRRGAREDEEGRRRERRA